MVWSGGVVQVIAELDRSPFSELRRYTATDITPAFGPNLLQMVGNPKLEFKVGPALLWLSSRLKAVLGRGVLPSTGQVSCCVRGCPTLLLCGRVAALQCEAWLDNR